jgi:hypothetical protein
MAVVKDDEDSDHPTQRRFTFRVIGTSYRCHLHSVPCAQIGCKRQTFLGPLCPPHAQVSLGVRVRRVRFRAAASPGHCGLFAERDFFKGDLICPYLGRRVVSTANNDVSSSSWWHCPESSGTAEDSGFAVSSRDGARFDASCNRSYGAMANHADETSNNASLIRLDGVFVLKLLRAWRHQPYMDTIGSPWYQIPSGEITTNDGFVIHRIPVVLLLAFTWGLSGSSEVGLHPGAIWICAKRPIRRGEEITVDYGGEASHIVDIHVRTMPSLATYR